MRARESGPKLLSLLEDPWLRNPLLRNDTISVIGELRVREAIPRLVALLPEMGTCIADPDAPAHALGALSAREAGPQLLGLLNHSDPDVRARALCALSGVGTHDAVPKIVRLLADDNAFVRGAAVQTLADLDARERIPDIAKLLEDGNPLVRGHSALALVQLQAHEEIPDIARLLDDKDPVVLASEEDGDLFVLNAVRQSDLWRRLRNRRLARDMDAPKMRVWEELVKTVDLELELVRPVGDTERRRLEQRMRVLNRQGTVSVLEVLEDTVGPYEFILEPGRIRLVRRPEALAFWKAWWAAEKK
jgi:HEAT repeat protein